MLSKEHAAVLAGIQAELIDNEADRIERSGQAWPVYYGIIDREAYITAEGWHEDIEYFDVATSDDLDSDEVARRVSEYAELNGCDEQDAAENWHEDDDDILVNFIAHRDLIARNCMFLTRAEAEAHLAANRHHYTSWAHTYAMTAWRSPMVDRLLKVLHEADFDVEDGGDAS